MCKLFQIISGLEFPLFLNLKRFTYRVQRFCCTWHFRQNIQCTLTGANLFCSKSVFFYNFAFVILLCACVHPFSSCVTLCPGLFEDTIHIRSRDFRTFMHISLRESVQ